MNRPIINIIAAVDAKTNGIGLNGGIPWSNKDDMKWFKEATSGHCVIMGSNTYKSIKSTCKTPEPLPNRFKIIISSKLHINEDNIISVDSIDKALKEAKNRNYNEVFVIGGASIYKQFLDANLVDNLYIDYVVNDETIKFDTYFPFESVKGFHKIGLNYDEDGMPHDEYSFSTSMWKEAKHDTYGKCIFTIMNKINVSHKHYSASEQYRELLKSLIETGERKETRSGVVYSKFGKQLRFPAMDTIPLLTTKKVYAKGCIHELLWFLSGNTNIKYLVENNTHIWDDDAYRFYLELVNSYKKDLKADGLELVVDTKDEFIEHVKQGLKLKIDGLSYTFGDLGPVYGKQWTDWNGMNQISEIIERIKVNPNDRRLIVNAWNVSDLDKMALPPCHYAYQFYVNEVSLKDRMLWYNEFMMTQDTPAQDFNSDNDKIKFLDEHNVPKYGLSLMWNQRSVDVCLGLPYNMLSYSILLHMVAQVTNLIPKEIIVNMGDYHIYENHIEPAKKQIERNPYLFCSPKLELNKDIKDINDFKFEDIKIIGYESYPAIRYELKVGLK